LFEHQQHINQIPFEVDGDVITADFVIENEPYRLFLTAHPQQAHSYLVLFGHVDHCDPLGNTQTGHAFAVFSAVMQLMCRAANESLPNHLIKRYYWSALGHSRQRLYRLLMRHVAKDLGWQHSQTVCYFPGSVGPNEECYLIYEPG
jgi:hypothetical protein